MPDEIAKIGLDTADMSRSLDRISGQIDALANKHAPNASREVTKMGKAMIGAGNAARVMLSAFGVGGFLAAINSVRGLNQELDAMRNRMADGSKELRDLDKEAGQMAGTSTMVDKTLAKAGIAVKTFVAKSIAGWMVLLGQAKKEDFLTPDDSVDAIEAQRRIQVEMAQANAKEQFKTEAWRISMMEKELELQKEIVLQAQSASHFDKAKATAAYHAMGDLKTAIAYAKQDLELSKEKDAAERAHALSMKRNEPFGDSITGDPGAKKIEAEYALKIAQAIRSGTSEELSMLQAKKKLALKERDDDREAFIASEAAASAQRESLVAAHIGILRYNEEAKIRLSYEERILAAQREGKVELQAQLVAERDIAIAKASVEKHQETGRDRLNAIRSARIEKATEKKESAVIAELARRDAAGIIGAKGSRLYEYQNRVKPPLIEKNAGRNDIETVFDLMHKLIVNTKGNIGVKAK